MATQSNLPVKHHLPSSHFSKEITCCKSLQEDKAKKKKKKTSELFFQTLGATTTTAFGFSTSQVSSSHPLRDSQAAPTELELGPRGGWRPPGSELPAGCFWGRGAGDFPEQCLALASYSARYEG